MNDTERGKYPSDRVTGFLRARSPQAGGLTSLSQLEFEWEFISFISLKKKKKGTLTYSFTTNPDKEL